MKRLCHHAPLACVLWILPCAVAGCGGTAPATDTRGGSSGGGTTTAATSGTATGHTTSGGAPVACEQSDDCPEDGPGYCVASYDPGTGTVGAAMCVPQCVGPADLERWCIDHNSCCTGLLCSAVDGFCYDPAGTGGGATSTGTSTGTSG